MFYPIDTESTNGKGYTKTQCQAGGRARAATAKRHPVYKIFLPDIDLWDGTVMFPSTYEHGVAGGKARSATATRINGRFAPKSPS